MHNIDETLDDVGVNLSPSTKVKQWLLPVDPTAYKGMVDRFKATVAV